MARSNLLAATPSDSGDCAIIGGSQTTPTKTQPTMNKSLTEIAYILDRSGSMGRHRQAAIHGFNEFLQQQKAVPGQANFTLVLFSSDSHIPQTATPICEASELNEETYIPEGATALLDAIGDTISTLGGRLAAMQEEERPGKVVVVIFTDGEENSSSRFTWKAVSASIQHQQKAYAWEFIFLGANQDAIATAANMQMNTRNSSNMEFSASGISSAKRAMSRKVSSMRMSSMGMESPDAGASMSELVADETNASAKKPKA